MPPTALLSFPRGLREIVDALAGALGARLRTNTAVEAVERRGTRFVLRTADGERLEGDRVVLAVPAPIAACLLVPSSEGIPVEHLRTVHHANVTLTHLGFERSAVPRLPPGFGYLVPPPGDPREPAPRALGTIFASNLFPGRAPEGCIAVSSFYASGGIEGLDDRGIVELASEDLARATATGEARTLRARTAEVRRWKDVIPRYAPGHADRMKEVRSALSRRLPGLHLAASYVAGVSVEQVITCGRATADEVLG